MKIIYLILGAMFTSSVACATSLSYRMGDLNSARLGFDLFKLLDVNAGLDYWSGALNMNYTSGSTVAAAGVQVSFFMPVVGTKVQLPFAFSKNLRSYLGADYFVVIPSASLHYSNSSRPNDGSGDEKTAKDELQEVANGYSSNGFTFYINSEYFFTDTNDFSLAAYYGFKWFNAKNVSSLFTSTTQTADLTSAGTFTQLAFNYYF